MRSGENSLVWTALCLETEGQRPHELPKKRWMDWITEDMYYVNVAPEDALDRAKWRQACQQADPAIAWD